MRIHFSTNANKALVPFDYQSQLTGAVHKWLGRGNAFHDGISLYSFSWLKGGKRKGNGLDFRQGATWFFSSPNLTMIKEIVKGVQYDPIIAWGMQVGEITLQEDPYFSDETTFHVCSPVFIKRRHENKVKFYAFDDAESGILLTETLQNKLKKADMPPDGVSVLFDKNYPNPKTKTSTYKGIINKGSLCPVVIKGTPEQVAFAWNVGVGNSTGIGFGSLI